MAQGPAPHDILKAIRWPLALTRAGMAAERIARAFWPLWSVLILAVGVLALGVQDLVPVEALWAAAAVLGVLALAALVWGVRAFRWPRRAEAMIRLDQTMPGRPIETALDSQATGLGDPASQALWQAHQARMRGRLAGARAPQPDLRVSRADPFALRYVALLTLCTGLLFGSLLRVGSVTAMAGTGTSPATGPTWEGWVEPPAYTHLPSLYLNDIDTPDMTVAEGSRVTLRPDDLRIDTEYLDGPFRYLKSRWSFSDTPEGGCTVSFFVDFEFRNAVLRRIIGVVFNEAMHRIVRAFEARAADLYG